VDRRKLPCIGWGQDQTKPFAAASGDKLVMRPFAKLLWTLVIFSVCMGFLLSRQIRDNCTVEDDI